MGSPLIQCFLSLPIFNMNIYCKFTTFMENEHTNNNSTFLKLLQFTGVLLRLFGFLVIGFFLTRFVLYLFTDINITEVEEIISGMEDTQKARHILLLMQGLNAFFTFILLPLLYILLLPTGLKFIFNVKTPKLGSFILLATAIIFTAMPFISVLVEWNQQIELPEQFQEIQRRFIEMEQRAEELTKLMIYFDQTYEIFIILIVIAVLPAIGEELLFRGIIQNEINTISKNPHLAIWITAFLFSFIHFQFLGFLPRMALGALFGYLYYWSGNLTVPIIMHFINNAFTFAVMNYTRLQGADIEETTASPALVSILTVVCILLLVAYQRLSIQIDTRLNE